MRPLFLCPKVLTVLYLRKSFVLVYLFITMTTEFEIIYDYKSRRTLVLEGLHIGPKLYYNQLSQKHPISLIGRHAH